MSSIVYRPECSLGAEKFISLAKPAQFMAGLPNGTNVDSAFEKATPVQLSRAHDTTWVREVLNGEVLNGEAQNGFYNSKPAVLEQTLWANGAFIRGAQRAVAERTGICVPVSGFHHAGYAYNGGYCTFNGLLVAERSLRIKNALAPDARVLIYDGDAHFGDGCMDIIARLRLPRVQVEYIGRNAGINLKNPLLQLANLPFQDYALVMYQAGADAWADDALGAGYLTEAELKARDELMFTRCKAAGVPVVWNLAGGYSNATTMRLHATTYAQFARVYG